MSVISSRSLLFSVAGTGGKDVVPHRVCRLFTEFGASFGTTIRQPSALPSRSCAFATADLVWPSPPILVVGLKSL